MGSGSWQVRSREALGNLYSGSWSVPEVTSVLSSTSVALLRGLHSRSLLRIIVSKEKGLRLGLIIFCPFIFKYTEKNPMNFQRKLKIKPKSGCSQNSPQTTAEDRGGMKPGPWEGGGRQSKQWEWARMEGGGRQSKQWEWARTEGGGRQSKREWARTGGRRETV